MHDELSDVSSREHVVTPTKSSLWLPVFGEVFHCCCLSFKKKKVDTPP